MKPRHVALAALTACIWGLTFVVIKVGLGSFPPLLLTALRFLVACTPAAVLPRPRLPWRTLLILGLVLFTAQFSFLFLGMAKGMPAGLASAVAQSQAFFTVLLAGATLGERPSATQLGGTWSPSQGSGGSPRRSAAMSPPLDSSSRSGQPRAGLGNVLLKRVGEVDMFALVAWLSLVPPLPATLLSLEVDGPARVAPRSRR